MKLRYGLLKKDDDNENKNKTDTAPLKDTGKSLNTMTSVSSKANSDLNLKSSKEKSGPSTEEILQKLNEMKAKMNSIVNANKHPANS